MKATDSDYTRRKFITTAASGLAVAGLTALPGGGVIAQQAQKAENTQDKKIIYRTLGKTGIKLPIVSMGVMNAGNPSLIQASYDAGIRHFDTAAVYQYGANEQQVGNVIKKMGVRDKVIIGTKIYTPDQRSDLSAAGLKKKLMTLTEGSLTRLKTDYIDILYLHSISSADEVNNPAVIEACNYLKESGKVSFIGLSTHSHMAEVINEAVKVGIYDVILTAINFTMADDTTLLNAIKNASDKGIGIIAMKTMAGGSQWPDPESRQNYSSSVIATAALKWVMRNKNIATAIPGYTNLDHMDEDFSVAYNLDYSPEEKKFLGDNKVKLSIGFCRQCGKCMAVCPNGVDIPTLMRTYMYAAQYSNYHLACETLNEIPRHKSIEKCLSCSTCSVRCANTVNIAQRIDALKMMYT